jgi:GTP cyclohydrolase II
MHAPAPPFGLSNPSTAGQVRAPLLSTLMASDPRIEVARAVAELVAGRPVIVSGATAARDRLVLPAETLDDAQLHALHAAGAPVLVISARRAAVLGGAAEVCEFALPRDSSAQALIDFAAGIGAVPPAPMLRADHAATAAIELAKLAKLLPAVVSLPTGSAGDLSALVRVDSDAVLAFRAGHARSLRRVSSALVPLRRAADAELIVFRDELGEHWSLILVGRPDTSGAVPVRLHSACVTGDAFGSLRCDCGDQLQMALAKITALGGGALVYLAQEGCGIGLANKMRAYGLQARGLDTIDANTALGFEADERRYDAAAAMLSAVGIGRVALLTNNPAKVSALSAAGIDVRERIPLLAPVGADNRRYLEAKRRRAGHLMGDTPMLAAV